MLQAILGTRRHIVDTAVRWTVFRELDARERVVPMRD
jgi:hypothetical protein